MNFSDYQRAWFDALAQYALRFHLGEATTYPIVEMGSIIKLAPSRRNLNKLHRTINLSMNEDGPDRDVRNPLLAHIEAILSRQFQGEFKYHYSETKGVVSATSEFFSLVRQAIDYHKDDAYAELKYIVESPTNEKYQGEIKIRLEEDRDRHFDVDEIRACLQDDGTITYMGCSSVMGTDRLLRPVVAFALMRTGVPVTLALNDVRQEFCNWETPAATFFKV